MSARIRQILEVVQVVRDRYSLSPHESITSLRTGAYKFVADRNKIRPQTVWDKYARQLRPEVSGNEDFDRFLEDWLRDKSSELEVVLRKYASGHDDLEAIDSIFGVKANAEATEADAELAAEFGFEPENRVFKEGKAKLALHRRNERNKSLIDAAKRKWKKEFGGNVVCAVCRFSFLEYYGEIGAGYIEAHHKLPVSMLTEETEVGIDDLDAVCSNCHKMLHQGGGQCLTIEELQAIILRNHNSEPCNTNWTRSRK